MAPSCCQRWLLLPWCLWWCWSRRRRRWWRVALCTLCYLLEALLVPGVAVHTVGGDLPPIGDVLADLVPVAIPLTPLAIVLGCREAHLVLLQKVQHRGQTRVRLIVFNCNNQRGGANKREFGLWIFCSLYVLHATSLPGAWASAASCSSCLGSLFPSSIWRHVPLLMSHSLTQWHGLLTRGS